MIDKFKEFLRNTPCPKSRNALESYEFNMKLYSFDKNQSIEELLDGVRPEKYMFVGFDWGIDDINYWCDMADKWEEELNKQNE